MPILFITLPLIGLAMAIWFWPRKPLPEPGSLSHKEFREACAAYSRVTSRRYWAAMPFLALAFALSLLSLKAGCAG